MAVVSGPKQVEQCHSMPSEATIRALSGLFRQFQKGILGSSLAESCIAPSLYRRRSTGSPAGQLTVKPTCCGAAQKCSKVNVGRRVVSGVAGRVALHMFGVLVMARQLYLVKFLQFRRSLTQIIHERSSGLQRLRRLVLVVAAQPEVRFTFLLPPHRRPVE